MNTWLLRVRTVESELVAAVIAFCASSVLSVSINSPIVAPSKSTISTIRWYAFSARSDTASGVVSALSKLPKCACIDVDCAKVLTSSPIFS